MKARFDTTQESVTVRQIDGIDYVYICLNENIVKEIPDGQEEEQTYHEYDYKEISEPTGTLDLADVKANPEIKPFWPRAGPTGGEGLAFPAGI